MWRGGWNEDGTRSNDTITFWSVNGQKLGDYAVTQNYGIGVTPAFYATQISLNYYFGKRLISNNNGWVYSDRLRSIGKFYPYGQEISTTTNGTEKFTGYFRDSETGNDYAVNRYAVPSSGRFITPDPSGARAVNPANPQSWNMYAYALGDPVNNRDPLGLDIASAGGDGDGGGDGCDTDDFYCVTTNNYYGDFGPGGCPSASALTPQPDPWCTGGGPIITTQTVAYAPTPSAIEVLSGCYNTAGGILSNRYQLVVTYEVVDQNGNRIFGSALAALTITENVVTTSGPQINTPTTANPSGNGSWSVGDGSITSTDTFIDLLNQGPFTEKTSLANQTFYINGVAVPIIGFGGTLGGGPTTLNNSYGPNMVTINGKAATQPCN